MPSVRDCVVPHLIDGHEVGSVHGSTFDVRRPHDDTQLVHKVACSTPQLLDQAVDVCQAGHEAWYDTPLERRIEVIDRVASILESRTVELVNLTCDELDSDQQWTTFDLANLAIPHLRGLVRSAETALADREIPLARGGHSTVSYEPYGVCLSIVPWNAPWVLLMRAVATPLLAGNTVVLKTSERSPNTHLAAARVFLEAGLPRDCLSCLHVGLDDAPEHVGHLLRHPLVRHVNYTGGALVGAKIAAAAGASLKPCLLELSGKAVAIVCADEPQLDLVDVAGKILLGTWLHAGQICMSTERVLVLGSREQNDAFCAALQKAADGHPLASCPQGLAMPQRRALVNRLLADARAGGAEVVVSPLRHGADASGDSKEPVNRIAPAIYARLAPEAKLRQEESFAPISYMEHLATVSCARPTDLDAEAVRVANAHPSGLSASVFTTEPARARKFARRLQFGAVHINGMTVADDPVVPHGGWKQSGFGRFNGVDGLREFTQTRSVNWHV